MSSNLFKRLSNVPPHVALISAIAGVIALASAALFFSESEPGAKASFVPRAARVERVEGNVGVARAFDKTDASDIEWDEASVNSPVSVGDRVYAHPGSRASLAFTGRNYARLDPGASLDVLSLADRRTQLALRDGSAIFDVGHLEDGELFEVATPNGAVDFYEPGLYQVGIDDNGSTMISVLSGLAQVVGLAGSGQVSKGEILTLVGQAAAQVLMSRLSPDLAGGMLDDYYGYRYPNSYDGRYRSYDRYLDDPYYYDSYRRSASYRYVPHYDVAGLDDLDNYGDWVDVNDYGRCWSPRVHQDWAPYQSGNWVIDDVWGPTWVSQEPWGWAPYHYGRWAYVNDRQWVWVPDRATARPTYSPALVAFVPLRQTSQIAWVPLAPGEPYVPRYYDTSFQPQYLAAPELVSQVINNQYHYSNLNVARAVAVVPVREFTEVIEPDLLYPVNQQLIAQSQPVLDPYAVDGLRQVAMRGGESRRRMKLPRVIEQHVFNTPVITSMSPVIPPDRAEMLSALQVSPVPEKRKKNKMKVDESGQIVAARRADGLPQFPTSQPNGAVAADERKQRITQLASQAAQGDKAARREMRELKRQQRTDGNVERAAGGEQTAWHQQARAQQQAKLQQQAQQGVVVDQSREQKKAQRRLERQQRVAFEQQKASGMNRQAEAQRQRQVKQQQAAQPDAPHRWVDDLKRGQQRKAQRQAERQQRAAAERQQQSINQQAVIQQQAREQRKAQRQAERQQYMMRQQQRQVVEQQRKQPVFIQPVDKNREQRKAERRAAREQAAWQQQARPQQQVVRQQQAPQYQPQQQVQQRAQGHAGGKAERKAERAERKAGRGKP